MAGQHEVNLVEEWTEEVPFTLREDGQVAPYDSSTSVELDLHDKFGQRVTPTGTLTRLPDSALVGWVPGAGDLLETRSPYSLRFKLTDADTARVRFYPNGTPVLVRVHKP